MNRVINLGLLVVAIAAVAAIICTYSNVCINEEPSKALISIYLIVMAVALSVLGVRLFKKKYAKKFDDVAL